ncbi:hypothetical protein NA57DRAFT_50598 [Rhizodiscina lignyota]|uniref:Uncharacterized protein n=1 Tax=Rhizodiscina lignyota TaxID=1504668 RepID=A0A9P4ILH7_9PEZI|nr:hypothetical protein NA57DRAFT_50598 [Rhizodiscina lignyota]
MSTTASLPSAAESTAPPMMRTASTDSAVLAHPKPDLQTTQGAYVGNVERLEESAERLSMGSDIGEEIRKLQIEQKLSESLKSSLHLDTSGEPVRSVSQRSRNASYSSHNNSIVDVNQAARWGGYSPSAYIGSPVGSITSGSWSQPSLQRQRSASKATRLGTVTEPEATAIEGMDYFSPSTGAGALQLEEHDTASKSSFAEELRAIAQDIERQLDESMPSAENGRKAAEEGQDMAPRLESPIVMDDLPDRPPTAASNNTYHEAQKLFRDFDGVHYAPSIRGPSGATEGDAGSRHASMMSIRPPPQAETWVQPPPDDGMIFYPAPVPKILNLPQKLSKRPAAAIQAKRRDKMMSTMDVQDKEAAPWLNKDNHSRELSLGGQGSVAESDWDRPLGLMEPAQAPAKATMAAPAPAPAPAPRKGILKNSLAGLPPQLRATMFFDAQPKHQEVEVQADSAIATLDSVLEASAALPASAFTDHPFAGHEGAKVYKREGAVPRHPRRSTTSILDPERDTARKSTASLTIQQHSEMEVKKRRSSFGLLFGKRSHSTNEVATQEKLRASQNSRLTMRTQSDFGTAAHERQSADVGEDTPLHENARPDQGYDSSEGEGHYQEDHSPEGQPEDEESEEELFGPPTTLLAELQKRKAQQKSRNRTAATAFPGGMHSTLLEMDAVVEVEQKRRIKKRVALAWEDPDAKAQIEAENDDDEVPLGMLFTKSNGVVRKVPRGEAETHAHLLEADWDRPLGLIEQRELEDNEPLSKRMNRLKGVEPQTMTKRNTGFGIGGHGPQPSASQLHLPTGGQGDLAQGGSGGTSPKPDQENEEEEGETLGQRLRRLKTRSTLDNALGGVESRPLSSDFAGELLGQFGGTETETGANNDTLKAEQQNINTTPDPDETLGQRRARLQAQQDAVRQTSGSSQPLDASRLSSGMFPSAQEDGDPQQQRTQSGLGLTGLRASRSMADLLAAHPLTANAHTARKVSDEMLTNNMPSGSLLAQAEVRQRRNKKRLSDANALGSGGLEKPLVDIEGHNRKSSGGMEFDRGMLGAKEQERLMGPQQPQMMNQASMFGMDPMSMQMNGVSMNGAAMSGMAMNGMGMGGMGMNGLNGMNMGMGMPPPYVQNPGMMGGYPNMAVNMPYGNPQAHMSMGYLPQMQMGMGTPNGMGAMSMMQNPMGMASTPNFAMPQSTYASFAQQQMGAGNQGGVDPLAGMRPEQRDLIDRWRQSVLQ